MPTTPSPSECPKCGAEQIGEYAYCTSPKCGVVFASLAPEALAAKAAHAESMKAKFASEAAYMRTTEARLLTEKNTH